MWAGLNLTERGSAAARATARERRSRGIRSSSSARSRWCGCSPGCASTRSSACASARSAGKPTRPRRTATERVCLLDVPTNKTATAFTKPVDRTVGDAIDAWEQVRPAQPEVRGSQDRRARRHAVLRTAARGSAEVRQPGPDPAAVPQGRRSARGRPRSDHRASRAGDDRQPALQRQGPDVAVRAAGVARALHRRTPPSTTRGSPRSP